MIETILTNAAVVLADQVIRGSVVVRDGLIAEVAEDESKLGDDCDGDWLIPGIVELHTDHLESHYHPRPGVAWPAIPAVMALATMARDGTKIVMLTAYDAPAALLADRPAMGVRRYLRHRFIRIVPLYWVVVVAAFLFVFIPTLGEFITPSLVGGATGYMYGNQIVDLFGTGFPDWDLLSRRGGAICENCM